ncbi:flagellar basal body protein FliL [Clostridium acetobutylicum]|nr:flagellar basal body protein FliL [Clostridium acetobutylicum]
MSEKKKDKGEKGGGKSKIIIILLMVIIVVFIAAALAYFFVFSKKSPTSTNTTATNAATTTEANVEENTYSFEEILTNLADTDGAKYIKVTVAVGYSSKNSKLKTELEDTKEDIKTPIMRDIIVNVLRSKKAADFTPTGIDQMKKEIKEGINPHLKNGQIDNVYFSNLVIQQ